MRVVSLSPGSRVEAVRAGNCAMEISVEVGQCYCISATVVSELPALPRTYGRLKAL